MPGSAPRNESRRSSPAPTPRPAPRKRSRRTSEEVRVAILEAAAQQFATRGLGGTRVAHIAELAGVSSATLYAQFKSKEQLFVVASLEPFIAFAQEMGELWDETTIAGTDDHQITETYVWTLYRHLSQHRDSIRAVFLASQDPHVDDSSRLARREFASVLRKLEAIAIRWLQIRDREMPDAGYRVRSTVSLVLSAVLLGDWLYGGSQRTVETKALPTIVDIVYKANST